MVRVAKDIPHSRQDYGSDGYGSATGHAAKVTAFGEAEFRVNVSDRIEIRTIGEARLLYMGNPAIVKGIHIGGVDLQKLD